MKLTVFTTVLGSTDSLRVPIIVNPEVRYVCITDREIAVTPYKMIRVVPEEDPKLQSRQIKILANHPALNDPDVVLWHDAAFRLRCDPIFVASKHLTPEYDMVAFRHPHRSLIEDEAQAIAKLGMMPLDTLTAQVKHYRESGFENQTAITSTGFSLRRRTDKVRRFNELWWNEVATWGYRDQMSVDYAVWMTDLKAAYIPGHYRDNPYAVWFPPPRPRFRRHANMRPPVCSSNGGEVDGKANAYTTRMDYIRRRLNASQADNGASASTQSSPFGSPKLRQ